MNSIKAAAALDSVTSSLALSSLSENRKQPGQDQGQDQHLKDKEEFILPLRPVTFPKVIPYHQYALADQGWSTLTYDTPSDKLHEASLALFQASQAFFDCPLPYKKRFKTADGSEEGWSRIEGEKELITLRCLKNMPEELKDAATAYWAEAGGLLNEILGRIAESLGLPAEALTRYSEPCSKLAIKETATMLRLFRYEGFEGKESKTVAEPHRDLGLLSLVNGDTPGLEVWDHHVRKYFQIERTYQRPAGSLLVGRQLERLSNGRYRAGGHQVRSYPDPPLPPDAKPTDQPGRGYRYSIVFVLRAHYPIPIDSDTLTTPITGQFRNPLKNTTAWQLFKGIRSSHFNVNTHIEEREKQKKRLAEQKGQIATPVPPDQKNEKAR